MIFHVCPWNARCHGNVADGWIGRQDMSIYVNRVKEVKREKEKEAWVKEGEGFEWKQREKDRNYEDENIGKKKRKLEEKLGVKKR